MSTILENVKTQKKKSVDTSSSSDTLQRMTQQEHARTRLKPAVENFISRQTSANLSTPSKTSLTASITTFRNDFEELKCKMRIFGESLSLCNCIASDFKNKLTYMENRLVILEKRLKLTRSESNYSAIIQKNKKLANKIMKDAKVLTGHGCFGEYLHRVAAREEEPVCHERGAAEDTAQHTLEQCPRWTQKLQMCGTEEEMREVAGRICRNYLHGAWKVVDPSQLEFRRISGGLSNFLYYLALPDDMSKLGAYQKRESSPDTEPETIACRLAKNITRSNSFSIEEPKKVLLRIYGQVHGERAMDAIVTESVIFTLLSERRLGPKLHGVFSGGRIEEYIPARCLLNKELSEPALSMKIAEKMAAIHSMDVPLSKEPNWIWKTMGKWLKTAKEDRWSNNQMGKNETERRIMKRLKNIDFDKEIEWLKKFVNTFDSPIVFCHNDMQEGNILLVEDIIQPTSDDDVTEYLPTYTDTQKSSKENNHTRRASLEPLYDDATTSDSILSQISDSGEPRLVLIDYEYCAYNYRAFDMANHFQEWSYDYTNPEYPFYFDYQENSPTLEQKEIFIKEYLKHYNSNMMDKQELPSIDDINKLLAEVEAFALASHLFWTLWSINVSTSQIEFGYWEYAQSRLETYLRLKQEVIKKDKFGYPQKRKICEVDI